MILRNNLLGLFNEYHWSTGETTQYIYVNQPGKYWVEAIQYCEDSLVRDSINITIDSVPQTDWEESVTECENSPVVLHAPYCSQCIYQWSTGETSDSIVVTLSGRYGLIVENVSRCQSEDSIDVEFGKCECELYVPNSFTPNNDGINEIFKPVYYCDMVNFEMRIFNRMGKVVYTSTNSEEGWNGFTKDSAGIEDIYNYTIQYTPVIKGKATSSINKAGMVALIY
jgi:gliding motility-associated-like protein